MWEVEAAKGLLRGREENEAYLAATPGEVYAIYFPDGGAVDLDRREHSGSLEARWIDIGTGEWGPRGTLSAGGGARVETPASAIGRPRITALSGARN